MGWPEQGMGAGGRVRLEWLEHPVLLVLNALAAYRLTRLWVSDSLPPLPRLRDWWQMRAAGHRPVRDRVYAAYLRTQVDHAEWHLNASEDEREEARLRRAEFDRLYPESPLAALVTCYWCSGFWVSAAVVAAATFLPGSWWYLLAGPLAISAVVGLIASRTED